MKKFFNNILRETEDEVAPATNAFFYYVLAMLFIVDAVKEKSFVILICSLIFTGCFILHYMSYRRKYK